MLQYGRRTPQGVRTKDATPRIPAFAGTGATTSQAMARLAELEHLNRVLAEENLALRVKLFDDPATLAHLIETGRMSR